MPPSGSCQALLLVDGYNIIGAWSYLQKIRDRDSLEFARLELVEALINYAAMQEYDTQVVFDAHYQNTPAYSENYTNFLSVYYTAHAQTADTYIERFCASFAYSNSRLIVATSDGAQKLTVLGYGAEWMSAQRLITEIDLTARSLKDKKRSKQKHSSGRFLMNSLDPHAQKILMEWRKGNRVTKY